MLNNIYKIFFIVILTNGVFFAQWKLAGAKGNYLFNITSIDSSLYIGADKAIYVSNRSGINDWKKFSVDIRQIQRFIKYDDKIIAIANSGIYAFNTQTHRWDQINENDLSASCLLILNDIWLAGITCDGVYRSTNNGVNWIYNSAYDYDSLSCVSSLLEIDNKIYAVSKNGLQVSNDKGINWEKINTSISSEWHFSNTLLMINDTIYAGGMGGIVKSTDRGSTWQDMGLKNVTNIININDKIFATTMSSVFFSNDYGYNWIEVYSDGYEEGWGFQPFCLEGFGDKIFLATGRGLYYMNLNEFDSPRLTLDYKAKFDFGPIQIGEQKDTIIFLENRGYKDLIVTDILSNSSYLEVSPRNFILHPGDFQIVNIRIKYNNPGIIDANLIIKSNNLEAIKEIPVYASLYPLNFYLSQNYPNPFNASTEISYLISSTNHVKIEVYNTVGERIVILIDEVQDAGKHKIIFNTQSLPSGIYFYKMTAGNYVNTKKMILLK